MKKIWFALCLASASVNAADIVNITVRGTLVRPPCQLQTGTSLAADFGNVRTDQVAQTAMKSLTVTLNCPAGSELNVSFTSSNGTYTSTIAKTTATNLGVSLLWADNSSANLQGVSKAYRNLSGNVDLSLRAKLVTQGELSPTQFNSSIVMTISYL